MKMKEAEIRSGLDRKNIRYYESEELLAPRRTEGNRYRDYSEEDIERLLEIRFLRQLGIPIRDIRGLFEGRLTLSELMRMRLDRIDGEMSQLKKLEQMCARLEEQQTLKPSVVEQCLEEISREDGENTWLEDIRKDWKMFQKELHSQYIYFEPEGEILTPEDFARETALYAARRNLNYETIRLESTCALVRLEGIAYQASLTFGPSFRLARLPLVKLVRCTPPPHSVSKGKYLFFVLLPTILMFGSILFCLIDSQVGARFSGIYRTLIIGCFIAAILLISVTKMSITSDRKMCTTAAVIFC